MDDMARFDNPELPGAPRWRRRAAVLCALLGTAGLVLAAMRPHSGGPPARQRGVVELVLDVSATTAASDLAPSRLGALQRATLGFLEQVPARVQVGVVAFSDRPVTLAQPGTDRKAARDAITRLRPGGTAAIGDAVRHALGDLPAAATGAPTAAGPGRDRARAPTVLLLVSDGTSASLADGGRDARPAARAATARHVPVHTITLGSAKGVLPVRIEDSGLTRNLPAPSDPGLLSQIAGLAGGGSAEARSASELDSAFRDFGTRVGLISDYRDLTLLLLTVALLLLAVGALLWPGRRAGSEPDRRGARARGRASRLVAAALLVLAAGGALLSWAVLAPARALPAPPAVVAAAPKPAVAPFVAVDASATKGDQRVVDDAAALLRRHGEMAPQRRAEGRRLRREVVGQISVGTCAACERDELGSTASNPSVPGFGKAVACEVSLNWAAVRREARSRGVSVAELTALALANGQERCLLGDPDAHQPPAVPAELRLARKLGEPRLFEVHFMHVEANRQDLEVLEQAAAVLREQGELAPQRRGDTRRRHFNDVKRLYVIACDGCLKNLLGQSLISESNVDLSVGCGIELDMSGLRSDARNWGLSVVEVAASTLIHEQEHCVRDPDDRETPAIDAEVRLARKLGNPRLLEYTRSSYQLLDSSGHWKT
jgi:Ca-activated chloride channel family protein